MTAQFPPTLPQNTVVGRLALGAGPAEAIPFTSVLGLIAPGTITTATYTMASTDTFLIFNASGTTTVTLSAPSAANAGRSVTLKTIAAQAVVSASSNVVPLIGGAAGTAILAATAGKWAQLVSDGTNWNIMASN